MAKTDRPDGVIDLLERTVTKPKTERPKLYKDLLFNDDYTPFEVVVIVLKRVFGMTEEKATQVMWAAHTKDVCVCGVFSRDVAETKVQEATRCGQEYGAALRFDLEPEE